MCIALCTLAAAPTSRSSEPQIRAWFNQLADSDGSVRDKAIENLMGLTQADLPVLHQVVAQSMPLKPSQKIVIRDIVTQIYISGMDYAPLDQPFLGLQWSPPPDFVDPNAKNDPGIIVTRRLHGFDAYRMVRDGDVILAIETDAAHSMKIEGGNFADLVSSFHVGQTITLRIMRDGREFTTRITLRAKPADLAILGPPVDAWVAERENSADEYWMKNFSDLVGEELS